jgi:hypothetical protein
VSSYELGLKGDEMKNPQRATRMAVLVVVALVLAIHVYGQGTGDGAQFIGDWLYVPPNSTARYLLFITGLEKPGFLKVTEVIYPTPDEPAIISHQIGFVISPEALVIASGNELFAAMEVFTLTEAGTLVLSHQVDAWANGDYWLDPQQGEFAYKRL